MPWCYLPLRGLTRVCADSAVYKFLQGGKGELDPMQAMLTRKLTVKGNMGYMMRNVPTVLEFVKCAKAVTEKVLGDE